METNETPKRRGRPRTNEKINELPIPIPIATELVNQSEANSVSSEELEELQGIMEALFSNKCRTNHVVIYDILTETFRSVQVNKPFDQIGKGLRAMRLSIIKKKLNPNEIIVNAELILAIEHKKNQQP